MTALPYQAWEYRVLDKGYSTSDTAKLLKRDEAEIERKQLAYSDTSLARWYRRHRTQDAPETVCRVRALAKKIWQDEFKATIEPGDLDHEIIHVLKKCFKGFDKSWAPDGKFIEDAFVEFFRLAFKRRLMDLKAGVNAANNRRHAYLDDVAPVVDHRSVPSEKADEFTVWSRHLLRLAMTRLDKRMRQVVELRHVKGLNIPEASMITGLSQTTIRSHFGFGRVVAAIKKEVNAVIMNIPTKNLDRIIYYLHYEADFTEKDLSELLCIPNAMVDASLDRSMGKILKGLEREKVMSSLKP